MKTRSTVQGSIRHLGRISSEGKWKTLNLVFKILTRRSPVLEYLDSILASDSRFLLMQQEDSVHRPHDWILGVNTGDVG